MKVRIGVGTGPPSDGGSHRPKPPPGRRPGRDRDSTRSGCPRSWARCPPSTRWPALAFAAAQTPRLKLGDHPGASRTQRGAGRPSSWPPSTACPPGSLLVTFVPGLPRSPETESGGGCPRWTEGCLDGRGAPAAAGGSGRGRPWTTTVLVGTVAGVTLAPPARSESRSSSGQGEWCRRRFERCGRFADGWLPSLVHPGRGA